MNDKTKYNILLIEPSIIISEGLINIINKTKSFKVHNHINDLRFFNKSGINVYDIVIVDLCAIDYEDRYEVQSVLCNDFKPVIIPIIINIGYDEQLLKQFNFIIGLNDSSEIISKKLLNAMELTANNSIHIKSELSIREKEILISVAVGKSNKEIAKDLNISVYTVITHRKNISHKLGINSPSGLTMYAIMNNLIDVSDFT